MDHDIGGIEYIVPIRDVLYVDEVDHTAIHNSIQYVAGAATDYEAKADILIAIDHWTKPEIGAYADQKRDANHSKYPAHPLQHTKHTAIITNVSEVDQSVPLDRRVLCNRAIYPVPN